MFLIYIQKWPIKLGIEHPSKSFHLFFVTAFHMSDYTFLSYISFHILNSCKASYSDNDKGFVNKKIKITTELRMHWIFRSTDYINYTINIVSMERNFSSTLFLTILKKLYKCWNESNCSGLANQAFQIGTTNQKKKI